MDYPSGAVLAAADSELCQVPAAGVWRTFKCGWTALTTTPRATYLGGKRNRCLLGSTILNYASGEVYTRARRSFNALVSATSCTRRTDRWGLGAATLVFIAKPILGLRWCSLVGFAVWAARACRCFDTWQADDCAKSAWLIWNSCRDMFRLKY